MPFGLIVIGLLLIITGFQNTYAQFGSQLEKDFTGSGNFFYWIVAIGSVGALGYNKTLEPFSRAFMALILVGIFLSNKGFFSRINSDILSGSETQALPAGGVAAAGGASGGGGSGSGIGGVIGDVEGVAKIASFFGGL